MLLHTLAVPVIVPGCAGTAAMVTESVRGVDAPQVLLAVTEIVPPFEPVVVVIEFELEVPDQPLGNVQV